MKTSNYYINWRYEGLKTTCTIRDINKVGEEHPKLSEGRVSKTCKDVPNKDLARRKSLKKALAGVSKNTRAEVWEQYRTMTNTPRW